MPKYNITIGERGGGKTLKAKEMFEELGYVCSKHINVIAYRLPENKDYAVYFDLQSKCIDVEPDGSFNIEQFQAIHQQLKELGWLDA